MYKNLRYLLPTSFESEANFKKRRRIEIMNNNIQGEESGGQRQSIIQDVLALFRKKVMILLNFKF